MGSKTLTQYRALGTSVCLKNRITCTVICGDNLASTDIHTIKAVFIFSKCSKQLLRTVYSAVSKAY